MVYIYGLKTKATRQKGGTIDMTLLQRFLQEEDALGTVELILIIVVLVGLVAIFKKQLVSLVNKILAKITTQSNSI